MDDSPGGIRLGRSLGTGTVDGMSSFKTFVNSDELYSPQCYFGGTRVKITKIKLYDHQDSSC